MLGDVGGRIVPVAPPPISIRETDTVSASLAPSGQRRELFSRGYVVSSVKDRAAVGAMLALLLTACGSASAAMSAPRPQSDIVLTSRDFGHTILLHQGQSVAFDLPGWDIYGAGSLLQPLTSQSSSGKRVFRTTGIGSDLMTALLPPPPVHCPYGVPCIEQAPRYAWFAVVAVAAGESFDLAVSQLDKGDLLLVAPGMRIIAAVPARDVTNTNPAVLSAAPYATGTLTVLSPTRPGLSRIFGGDFRVDVLVRPAGSEYDRVLSEKDGGRTITTSVGQVIRFLLANSSGFRPWTAGISRLLRPIVDPTADKLENATAISYLVVSTGKDPIGFSDDPICTWQPNCRLLTRTIRFEVVSLQ